jgi:hypothetical protein
MTFFISLIAFMSVFLLGMRTKSIIFKYELDSELKKKVSEKNEQFSEILNNIKFSKFRSRVNATVYVSSKTSKHGDVDIIYLMDKSDVAIFQGDTCLYTSESVEKEVIFNIIESINKKFKKNINDTVEVLGFTFYREDFEKTFGGKFKNLNLDILNTKEENEIESIKQENEKKFNIDEILDKISTFGIKVLTPEELEFLDEYGKKN